MNHRPSTKEVDITEGLLGLPTEHDILYRVTGPNFVIGFTEYNDEVTGFAPLLAALFKREIKSMYGARVRHLVKRCLQRRWKVERIINNQVEELYLT